MDASGLGVLAAGMLVERVARRYELPFGQVSMFTPFIATSIAAVLTGQFFQQLMPFGESVASRIFGWPLLVLGLTVLVILYVRNRFWFKEEAPKKEEKAKPFIPQCTLRVFDPDTTDLFQKYISDERNIHMFDMPKELDLGDVDLIVATHTALIKGLPPPPENRKKRNVVRSATGSWIKFHDTNLGVVGQYSWQHREIADGKTDNNTPPPPAGKLSLRLPFLMIRCSSANEATTADCKSTTEIRCSEYITSIGKWLRQMEVKEKTTFLWHRIYAPAKRSYYGSETDDVTCEVIYEGPPQPAAVLEKFMSSFYQKQKPEMWKMLQIVHHEPDRIHELGQFPQIGYILHGPPGTGKSTFGYRVARSLQRHIISVDLRSIQSKKELHRLFKTPQIGGQIFRPNQVIFMFDEIDQGLEIIWLRSQIYANKQKEWAKKLQCSVQHGEWTGKEEDARALSQCDENAEVLINDLLAEISGVIPSEGPIYIATTNRFEYIKTLCPALFREQRFKPCYFGYHDLDIIQQICQDYWSKRIEEKDIIDHFVPLRPSAVVEMLIGTLQAKEPFEYFQNCIAQAILKPESPLESKYGMRDPSPDSQSPTAATDHPTTTSQTAPPSATAIATATSQAAPVAMPPNAASAVAPSAAACPTASPNSVGAAAAPAS